MDQRKAAVLGHLGSKGTSTALAISRAVGCTRQEANQVLYSLLENHKVTKSADSPPQWSRVVVESCTTPAAPKDSNEPRRVVVVDLGNTHDCLKELLPYARAGDIDVRAYADLAFNGYGVNPPLVEPGVTVCRANTADKNAADVDMIWDIAQLLGTAAPSRPQQYFVIVATKDQGFRRLKSLAEKSGNRLEFAASWADLRLYVE